MVVGVEPGVKCFAAGGLGGVGAGVGPFVGEGAVEPLDFPVGLGPVGAGALVGDVQVLAGRGPDPGAVAGAVVGQDALDGDAGGGVPGVRAGQVGCTELAAARTDGGPPENALAGQAAR
jgi:hypothetical protein